MHDSENLILCYPQKGLRNPRSLVESLVVGDYEEVWRRFAVAGELEFGGHTDPSWRHGHATSASFIVRVDARRMRERLDPIRRALGRFPFVSLHPDHFMHITLLMLGFPVQTPRRKGEISHARLRELETRARTTLSRVRPFRVRLANLNAFPSAAFIEAHPEGGLERLQELLSVGCGMRHPAGPPHLTLAYFHAPDGTRAPVELIEVLERFREWPVGEVLVEEVELSLLDLRAPYPKPRVLASIPLGGHTPSFTLAEP